jgi:hypothetical protein
MKKLFENLDLNGAMLAFANMMKKKICHAWTLDV